MSSEELQQRYGAIVRIVLREAKSQYFQAAADLGKEVFIVGGTPRDLLRLHYETVSRPDDAGPVLLGAQSQVLEKLLDALMDGWMAECRALKERLRQTLNNMERSLETARQTAHHRLRQLVRSNKLLLKEVLRSQKLERRVRAVKTWLQRAQDLAQLGFWVLRIADRHLDWYGLSRFLRKSGAEPRAIRSIDDILAWVHPDDRARVEESFAHIFRGQKPEQIEYRLINDEARFVRQEVALGRRKGQIVRALGVVMDITAVKKAEQAARAVERIAALGTLAAGIAHEINNPLGSATLSVETALSLLDRPEDKDSLRKCLENVTVSLERCARIVAAVLGFSRHEPGSREICDLGSIVTRCCEMVHPFLEQRRASLSLESAEPKLPVNACPLELELAITNLLRNAIQSRTSGVRILVRTKRDQSWAEVAIIDNGRGMTLQEVGRMFDPFYSGRPEEGGTGLGASLALAIVRDHGGQIDVRSSPGEGTTVRILLPLHLASAETQSHEGESQ